MYLSDIFTVSMNLAGVPAISLPCGPAKRGQSQAELGGQIGNLPVGLQIIGPQFGEATIFSVAAFFEENLKNYA